MCITFLFGSGADTDAGGLPSGDSFAKDLITGKHSKQAGELLEVDTSHFQLLHHNSSKIYIQTIYQNQEEAKKYLDHDQIESCIKYYNTGTQEVNYDEIKSYCSEYYKAITGKDATKDNIRDFFLENAVLFDVLDGKFNSLRYETPNANANKVMIAYTSVFVLMLKKLYTLPSDFSWSYENVFDKLKQPYSITIKDNCYYKKLIETYGSSSMVDSSYDNSEKSKKKYYIVTPNYTDIVANVTQEEVIYLHGKLTWFEDLRTLSVHDCIEDRDKINLSNKIIPFIMIPSGVKPIICTKQILQFSKFVNALNNSNILCVIGYRFNNEDNHINSIIAEWLKKESTQMIYFDYQTNNQTTLDKSKFHWIYPNTIESIEYNSRNDIKFSNSKVISIAINKDNSNEAFESFLNLYNPSKD